MFGFIAPHLRVDDVCKITLPRLREMGLESLLLDVDCTLKRYGDTEVSDEVAAWIDELRAAGIGLCLVSNGMGERIGRFAKKLDLPFVAKALKPFPFRLRAAMRRMGLQPKRTAMVGDQLFADIMAGRFAGVTAILVDPIHPEDEPWFTRLKRPPEQWMLRCMDVAVDEK